mmetsp:Transcript_4530/g.7223  ORF Transcript_4530/g.7223 Transcript_4530/m.7223 type:complete len:279 (-) Transcript_4530:174-1010(-)
MRSNHHYSVAIILNIAASIVVAQSTSSSCHDDADGDSSPSYTKLPAGVTTYGFDDGGCHFCAAAATSSSTTTTTTTTPLSGDELSQSCRQLCDFDLDCVAYTIGRPATLVAQQYQWLSMSNCCLEKRHYPREAFVDAVDNNSNGSPNSCQQDVMCWTRYEKKEGDELSTHSQQHCKQDLRSSVSLAPTPGANPNPNQCSLVWPATSVTDEEIQTKIDFIKDGCPRNDAIYEFMMAKAYEECKAEVFAESVGVSVIVLPESVYTLVSVDGALQRLTQMG